MRVLPALLLLLVPALALAKAPTRKEIDQQLILLSRDELAGIHAAENTHREALEELERAQNELKNAQLDAKAARDWVEAGKAVSKALDSDLAAAQAWGRSEEVGSLTTSVSRAEANLQWRQARLDAAQEAVGYQQTRVTWARAELARSEEGVELARLQAYDTKIGGSPDAQIAIGKSQSQLGKLGAAEAKERSKLMRAEQAWQAADRKAQTLDPAAGGGR